MNELKITAKVENLTDVLGFIESQLGKTNCSIKAQMQIAVAVEEIFVNIANYAYHPEIGDAVLRTEIISDPPAIAITFIDEGVPYNPLAKPDPDVTLPAAQRKVGGLGIFMVKKSMDDLKYEYKDGKNIFTLIKHL